MAITKTSIKIFGLDPEYNDFRKHYFKDRDTYINNIKNCISRILEHKHHLEIKQEMTFYCGDRHKTLSFVDGRQTGSKCYTSSSSSAIQHDKIPFEITRSETTEIPNFDCSDANAFSARIVVNITTHCPFIKDGWIFSLQIIRHSKIVDFYRAKDFKAKLFIALNHENFLGLIPWKNGDMILIKLEQLGQFGQLEDLKWVNETFAPTLIDKCTLQVQDIYVKVANRTGFNVNKFHTGEFAIKQLMPRVITLDHSNFADFMLTKDDYIITDKINGITTVCIVENDTLYIAGGNETYDFPLVGFNGWIFDAELVNIGSKMLLYPFDVRQTGSTAVHNLPFSARYRNFGALIEMNKQLHDVQILNKRWLELATHPNGIKEFSDGLQKADYYPTDGFVFVYGQRLSFDGSMYQATKCYKWKPRDIITIDFYVSECKNAKYPYVAPKGQTTVLLCNGLDRDLAPRLPGHIQIPLQGVDRYVPVMFRPSCNPFKHIAYLDSAKVGAVLGNIAEFSCDRHGAWHLERVRTDRINELTRGLSFGNDHRIAELNMFAIDHPIELEHLCVNVVKTKENAYVSRIGHLTNISSQAAQIIRAIYDRLKIDFAAYTAETILDHTICGHAIEKVKKYDPDIVHVMVTNLEINCINYINSKYLCHTRNYSYYVFGEISQTKSLMSDNHIPYPVLGAKLVISMFACMAMTNAETQLYLQQLKDLMHPEGRMIIAWCPGFGQSEHGFNLLTQASQKAGLMINDLPYEPLFEGLRMYVLNR